MSLPPGFLDELRGRVSLAHVVGRKVAWDTRKSNQGRGDMWAPCPFHQEKTASFHVDDRKGFYYCFGCHEKGDAIGFVMATENLTFIEAVRVLAGEAGLAMPERDPQAQQVTDRRDRIAEVLEAAAAFFARSLRGAAGAEARAYLDRRGLDEAARGRWEIGFAPAGWDGLREHLAGKGVDPELILAAGLVRTSDKGRKPYDVFRNRIMFPIRDGRGRAIGFGGRAMDPDDAAKYLNSPETELFDKGRSLYNQAPARAAAGRDEPLVVAEGYMDVIALSEAGLPAAVAPLGTAITEAQLQLMWRIHPEPVVALDGDTAGRRAALRLVDLALPMLEAGRSLRFCMMPPGMDPDDFIRSRGGQAMRDLVARAEPMIDLLWRRETEGRVLDSPERRAALDRDLRATIGRIADQSIRRHYADAIRQRTWQLLNPRRPARGAKGGRTAPAASVSGTRASALGTGGAAVEDGLREAVVLALVLRHPDLAAPFADGLDRIEFRSLGHAEIAAAIARHASGPSGELRDRVERALPSGALEKLLGARHLAVVPALRGNDPGQAGLCLAEELAKLAALRGAERELSEAMEDFDTGPDETLTWRLRESREAMFRSVSIRDGAVAEWEVAANGVKLDRDQVEASRDLFDSLLGQSGPSNRKE